MLLIRPVKIRTTYALHKGDRGELLLNMYSDMCRYDGNYSFINGGKDSKLDSFLYFYFITLLHPQKIIKEIKGAIGLIKPLKNKFIHYFFQQFYISWLY